jgi:hypothetical protein
MVPAASDGVRRAVGLYLVPVFLVVIAFLPILNNGFIADDFVNLERAENLKTNPLFLYSIPPENFRTTIYIVFAVMKSLFGYTPAAFYVFNILLHAANVTLLGSVLFLVTRDSGIAFWASCFWAVFAPPQEAVMWLGGMPESLVAFFLLLALLLWIKERPGLAALAFAGGLLSKESSVILLAIVPLVELCRGRPLFRRAYIFLLIPAALFALSFVFTFKTNTMLSQGAYKLGPQALGLLARSLLRLLWPWFYLIVLITRLAHGAWPRLRTVALSLAGVLLLLLPYMFVAYSPVLPSRNVYLASAALMVVFAILIRPIRQTRLFYVFAAVFILFNVGYLWLRKDSQFEERAAPTTALLKALEGRKPRKTLIIDFPYPYPEIASSSVLLLPGWSRDQILVGASPAICPECLQLKWNPDRLTYEETAIGAF